MECKSVLNHRDAILKVYVAWNVEYECRTAFCARPQRKNDLIACILSRGPGHTAWNDFLVCGFMNLLLADMPHVSKSMLFHF